MRKVFYGSIVMLECMALFGATIEPGDSSKRHKTDYVTDWTPQETQTYTVSASASGCSFVDSKTKASGGAILKSHSSSSASAEKNIEHTETPNASAFGFSVSGVLAGSGNGGEVTWSVTLQQKFFWLTVAPSIIVKAGTAITVTANGAPTESKWNINNKEWKDWTASNSEPYKASSITLNRNMWDKMKWTPEKPHSTFEAPTAGKHSVSATTTETTGARSASIDVHVVEISLPAKNGEPTKWLPGSARYDNQLVRSSIPASYSIPIHTKDAGRSDRVLTSSGGGTISGSNSKSYTPGNSTGNFEVRLSFVATGNEVIDTRTVTIFEDHLARDYYNFGASGSCDDGWKPLSKYGVALEDIDGMGGWNCHGSVWHAYNNSGGGVSATTVPWTPSVVRSEPDADFWKGISLKRGDVVAFYRIASDGTKTLAHSHTCITPSDKTMWGANNEGGWTNHWKWSLCTSEEYYNKTSPRVNYVEILPKP